MQSGPSRRLSVAVRHPTPLIASGVVSVLLREHCIDAVEWDGQAAPGDLLLADYETAIRLAADRHAGGAVLGGTRLAVIGTNGREAEVRAAIEAGVEGYLAGMCSVAELVACVRTVAAGGRYLSEGALRCVVDSMAHDALTPKELAVLQCMWEGMSNKAIARCLQISVGTAKGHVAAILGKLEARNRTQAVKVAVARGLIDDAADVP